jgi:hypothetical protein
MSGSLRGPRRAAHPRLLRHGLGNVDRSSRPSSSTHGSRVIASCPPTTRTASRPSPESFLAVLASWRSSLATGALASRPRATAAWPKPLFKMCRGQPDRRRAC